MHNFVDTPAALWYNMEGYIYNKKNKQRLRFDFVANII